MATYPTSSGERRLTIAEFEHLPDEECRMELVRGRVVREPPAGAEHGRLDVEVAYRLRCFLEEHPLGTAYGAETGFILATEPPTVRAPDAAVVLAARVPPEPVHGFFPGPPDLAVEIVSPSNTADEIQEKALDYLDAGCRLLWVVYPMRRSVAVYRNRSEIRLLGPGEELDGGDVLPGFRLPVERLFAR